MTTWATPYQAERSTMPEALIDPDCRSGKHGSCIGEPCGCECHGEGPS